MFVFPGLPLFLEELGAGNAGVPFAILPFFALRWATASARVMCSMCSSLELAAMTASFTVLGLLLRWVWAAAGLAEKKIGTNPEANVPSNRSALSGKAPSNTETALSPLKNFFWMLAAGVGRPWISNWGDFSLSMPIAHLRQAPWWGGVSAEDEEGGFRRPRKKSGGIHWPCPSVIGIVPCLLVEYVKY
jgi:hypothetical protein